MLNPFICGSFNHREEEDDSWSKSVNRYYSSPRKSRRSSRGNSDKNPFASRGLDKYSELLRELDDKRQKIYAQMGSDVSLVRFAYSSSNDCVPIIVKLRSDHKQEKAKNNDAKAARTIIKDKPTSDHDTEVVDKLPIDQPSVSEKEVKQPAGSLEGDKKTQKKSFLWNLKLHKWRRPSYYMPVAIILILLLLVFFGRSVTILCTSLGWYLVPTLGSKRPTTKKKHYARGFSEIKMVNNSGFSPPKRNIAGSFKDQSPPRHRKSF